MELHPPFFPSSFLLPFLPPSPITSFFPCPLPGVKVTLSDRMKWRPRWQGRDVKSRGMRSWSGSPPVLDEQPLVDVLSCGRPTSSPTDCLKAPGEEHLCFWSVLCCPGLLPEAWSCRHCSPLPASFRPLDVSPSFHSPRERPTQGPSFL